MCAAQWLALQAVALASWVTHQCMATLVVRLLSWKAQHYRSIPSYAWHFWDQRNKSHRWCQAGGSLVVLAFWAAAHQWQLAQRAHLWQWRLWIIFSQSSLPISIAKVPYMVARDDQYTSFGSEIQPTFCMGRGQHHLFQCSWLEQHNLSGILWSKGGKRLQALYSVWPGIIQCLCPVCPGIS